MTDTDEERADSMKTSVRAACLALVIGSVGTTAPAMVAGADPTAVAPAPSQRVATRVLVVAGTSPASGVSDTFTAEVHGRHGRHGRPRIAGTVTFSVVASQSYRGVKPVCAGGDAQTLVVDGGRPTATCVLPAGWLNVHSAKGSDPRPRTRWVVTAAYNGNGHFARSIATIRGTARS